MNLFRQIFKTNVNNHYLHNKFNLHQVTIRKFANYLFVTYFGFQIFKKTYVDQPVSCLGLNYESDYSEEQQKYLLNVLNQSTNEQLSRYQKFTNNLVVQYVQTCFNRFNLSKNRIKKIDIWRSKHGAFQSLSDVLEIDGWSVRMLDRLCKTIMEGDDPTKCAEKKPVKARGQILTPAISPAKLKVGS